MSWEMVIRRRPGVMVEVTIMVILEVEAEMP